METLYDLLGALPRDDADALRAAFRRAVKASHPDLRPGDPDAGMKFREIVRANEILGDQAQRAAYDHLLDLARIEQEQAIQQSLAGRGMHRLTALALGLAGLSATAIAGLVLFLHLSATAEPLTNSDVATLAAVSLAPTAEQAVHAPAARPEATDNAAPPLGPPIDIAPAPGVLDRSDGFDHADADLSPPGRAEMKKPVHAAAQPRRTHRAARTDFVPLQVAGPFVRP